MEASDMRSHPRAPVCCPADLFFAGAGQPEHAFVTDLSEGGAYVQTRHKLRRGDRLFMRVALSDDQVAALATEVTWVKRFEAVSIDGRLPGVGVRFVDLSSEDRSAIRGFLRSSGAEPASPEVSLPATPVQEDDVMQALPVDREPSMTWHDTDVDDADADDAEAEDGGMSLGYEPDLGELSLERSEPPQRTGRRKPRSLTPWLAAASLTIGVGAGALYGLLAPSPVPAPPVPIPALAELVPAVPEPPPVAAVEPVKPPAQAAKAQPTPAAPAARATPSKPAAETKPETTPAVAKATPTPSKPAAAAPTASAKPGEIALGNPARTGSGWFLTLRNAAKTGKGFALGGPARAVVDLPPGAAPSVQSRDIGKGPFGNLRVGRSSDRVRLVFDLDGVVSPSQVRFVVKGSDLVVEVPGPALARR